MAEDTKFVMAVPEPRWIRGDRGLLNLVFYDGVGVLAPKADKQSRLVVAWSARTGRFTPICERYSQEDVDQLLDFLAVEVGATILPEPVTPKPPEVAGG